MPSENNPIDNTQSTNQRNKDNSFTIPGAIILAGILIGAAIIYSGKDATVRNLPVTAIQNDKIEIAEVTERDHILGSANADIIFVEHSDTECPFCKSFHNTLHQIMDKYGKNGQVAWVYRHFPLYKSSGSRPPLHSKAGKEAEATECAAEIGGPQAFWSYVDKIFEITPSNNGLDLALLTKTAESIGLSKVEFNKCLESGKYIDFIEQSYAASVKSGGTGTPFTVVILKKAIDDKDKQRILSEVEKEYSELSPGSNFPPDFFRFDEKGDKISFSGALPLEIIEVVVKSLL